jgi:hypothetical protein
MEIASCRWALVLPARDMIPPPCPLIIVTFPFFFLLFFSSTSAFFPSSSARVTCLFRQLFRCVLSDFERLSCREPLRPRLTPAERGQTQPNTEGASIIGCHHHLQLASAGLVSIIHHLDTHLNARKAIGGRWERGLGGEGRIPFERGQVSRPD